MTALQFAARSGHFHMVQWFLQPRSKAAETTAPKSDRPNNSTSTSTGKNLNIELLDWVQHQDQQGQTALQAAAANQHEDIVLFLQEYIDAHTTSYSSLS
jgi:ankyrin repeat protein